MVKVIGMGAGWSERQAGYWVVTNSALRLSVIQPGIGLRLGGPVFGLGSETVLRRSPAINAAVGLAIAWSRLRRAAPHSTTVGGINPLGTNIHVNQLIRCPSVVRSPYVIRRLGSVWAKNQYNHRLGRHQEGRLRIVGQSYAANWVRHWGSGSSTGTRWS